MFCWFVDSFNAERSELKYLTFLTKLFNFEPSGKHRPNHWKHTYPLRTRLRLAEDGKKITRISSVIFSPVHQAHAYVSVLFLEVLGVETPHIHGPKHMSSNNSYQEINRISDWNWVTNHINTLLRMR